MPSASADSVRDAQQRAEVDQHTQTTSTGAAPESVRVTPNGDTYTPRIEMIPLRHTKVSRLDASILSCPPPSAQLMPRICCAANVLHCLRIALALQLALPCHQQMSKN